MAGNKTTGDPSARAIYIEVVPAMVAAEQAISEACSSVALEWTRRNEAEGLTDLEHAALHELQCELMRVHGEVVGAMADVTKARAVLNKLAFDSV